MPLNTKVMPLCISILLPGSAFADWTGGYAGLALGAATKTELSAEIDGQPTSIDLDGDQTVDLFAGYQVQTGTLVYGGELAISAGNDFEGSFEDVENKIDFRVLDLKGRAGYATDAVLIYGVLGLTQFEATESAFEGTERGDGFSFGIGADYRVSDRVMIGAEYLARRAEVDNDTDREVDFDTLSLRASFNF